MKIEYNNNSPIYLQICEDIKRKIVTNEIKPNEKISSVRNFALEYNVNPNTIVKTLNILEEEGYIYTDSTNGKFVVDDSSFLIDARKKLLNEKIESFILEMESLGYEEKDIIKILEERIK